jgi:hypothetical protein
MIPNQALLAWLEKETGKPLNDLISGERGEDAWKDIIQLVRGLAELVEMPVPDSLVSEKFPQMFPIEPTPKTDEDTLPLIVPASVLGLYPASNQGLLRDMREMLAAGVADGPIASFVRLGVNLDNRAAATAVIPDHGDGKAANGNVAKPADESIKRQFGEEKMITDADPCQAKRSASRASIAGS